MRQFDDLEAEKKRRERATAILDRAIGFLENLLDGSAGISITTNQYSSGAKLTHLSIYGAGVAEPEEGV